MWINNGFANFEAHWWITLSSIDFTLFYHCDLATSATNFTPRRKRGGVAGADLGSNFGRILLSARDQFVSQPTHCEQSLWLSRIDLDLRPNALNMDVERL